VISFSTMTVTRGKIESNLKRIRDDIAAACSRRGRDPQDVSIVAVTKTVEFDTIKNLLDAGMTNLGESRVQQLTARAEEMKAYLQRRRNPLAAPVRWHMIGHLQRNKVKQAINAAKVIHSVDSLRLAEEINARAEQAGKHAEVMLEVNCSQEPQKYGVAVGATTHLAQLVSTLKCVTLTGLMTMAQISSDPEKARPAFVRLRELFEEIRHEKICSEDFRHLSMGMSQDYGVAVEEGATILRIGTAIFS